MHQGTSSQVRNKVALLARHYLGFGFINALDFWKQQQAPTAGIFI